MVFISHTKAKSVICIAAAAADLALFLVKLYVAVSSNSISIYVDSLNSLADTLVCVLAVIGFKVASGPPDENYPFGLGRAEDIVNFLLSCVILGTGFAFFYTSLQRLLYPVPVWYMPRYAVLVASTAAVKMIMAFAFKSFGRHQPSGIISNLARDSLLDFFISACIVVSFTLTQKVGYSIDSVTGIAASSVIIVNGFKTAASTLGGLMGKNSKDRIEAAEKLIKDNTDGLDIKSIAYHSYADKTVYNVEINVRDGSNGDFTAVMDKLQKLFSKQLNAELYIKSGGYENEKEKFNR